MEKRKRTPRKWAATIVLLLLLPASLMAQQRQVPLHEALAFVRQYHPEVAVGKLKEQYQQTMMGTAKVIPKTQLELEAGQNEGPYFDARFGAIQSFQPMGLHRRQTGLLQSYYDMVKQQTVLAQKDAERLVKVLYSQYFAAGERDLVLAKIDSTVAKTLLLSRKRLETGESDRLELINVEQLEAGIRQQRVMLQFEQQALRRQLGLLLLSNEEVTPVGGVDPRSSLPTLVDTALLANHPLVQIRLQEAKSAEMATQVERALNNAEWLVGVNTLSVTGWQTAKDGVTDTYYDIGNRFVSGMVGVSIPLFARAQKARIKAAQQQEKVAAGSVDWQKQQLTMQYLDALTQWQSLQQQENYYRQEALPRANQLAETAQRRFAAGSISYIEWSMLMQQAIQTQLAYVDVQFQTILKSIDLQYYYSE